MRTDVEKQDSAEELTEKGAEIFLLMQSSRLRESKISDLWRL